MKMKGNVFYFACSGILGIIASSTSFHWGSTLVIVFFLIEVWRRLPPKILIICFCFFIFFSFYFRHLEINNHSVIPPSAKSLTGTIITPPHFNGDRLSAVMKTFNKEKVQLVYKIKSKNEWHHLKSQMNIGLTCRFEGRLEKPDPNRNENAFDYREYLRQQQIYWIFHARSITLDECYHKELSLWQWLELYRQKGLAFVEQLYSNDSAGFVQALIFGERRSIDENMLDVYQKLGIVHLIAISGLQVSLLSASLFLLGIRIGITRETMIHILFILLPIYIVIAGASPSVVRAGFMTMLILVAMKFQHTFSVLDTVSTACIIMLLINPYWLFQAGFQLSFLVTLALILSRKIISNYSSFFQQLLVVTFIAQMVSFPVILLNFYEFSLISIPANMIFVPVYNFLILPSSVISLFLAVSINPIGKVIVHLVEISLELLNSFAQFISKTSFFTITLGKPSMAIMIAYYIVIFIFFITWEKKRRLTKIKKFFMLVVMVMLVHGLFPYLNPYGEVIMIDVGQGDSIFIQLPHRQAVYLIDTGGTATFFKKEEWRNRMNKFDIGDDVVVPFLKSKGVREIDKLMITHGDLDHMGEAITILRRFKVKELVVPVGFMQSDLEKDLITFALKKKVNVRALAEGDYWKEGNTSFYILSPTPKGMEKDKNDGSLVIYTNIGGQKWLFTGDLGKNGENRLIHQYPNLSVDVLKVGHHGSNTSTSSEFLQHTRPKIALISAGKNNRYQHPHKEVIDELNRYDVKIYRTDLHGAIRYTFSKQVGTFHTTLP
jgi:competence protein ComEC